ncbi:ATP synthase subunit I [Aestuariirhabdus sp. Z084]|uniref:ATP synthase subunit I n=1 Tax=Aestuariirhabdus haliotis TaxID=2918751 RepID=UPI00201B37C1|nr:ATP synthase subunit I [Aestuariirhabdus haliotis]MCL6414229.1 ATP synthase subunit I [Aestuariirhabdus haliotis]MCL6418161.1 ATP synthase subunit I [Aestuariirhabdus haliotis]
MNGPASHNSRSPLYRLIALQAIATLSIGLVCSLISFEAAYSALLGGLVFMLPNALLIYKAFFAIKVGSARKIANSMYVGEAIKFGLTALLFAAVFVFVSPLNAPALFVTFFVVLMINSLSPLLNGRLNDS